MGFSDWSWTIGVAIYMIGRSTMALGANLQRYSMRKELERPKEERRDKTKQPLLVAGIVTYTGSGIFLSLALIFASPTLLAPCGTMIFASNCLFAHYLNKEPLEWSKEGICIGMIVLGTILVVVSAPKNNESYTNDELEALMQKPGFISFVSSVSVLVLITYVVPRWVLVDQTDSAKVQPEFSPEPLDAPSDHPQQCDESDGHIKGCDCCCSQQTKRVISYLCYGTLAGGLGGLNIILSKTIFSLIGGQASEHGFVGLFTSWLLYLFAATMIFTYITQMITTTIGLEKTPAMVFVPVQSVSEEGIAILGGLFYFEDVHRFDEVTAALFVFGECLSVAAVVYLTRVQLSRNSSQAAFFLPPAGDAIERPPEPEGEIIISDQKEPPSKPQIKAPSKESSLVSSPHPRQVVRLPAISPKCAMASG